VALTIQGLKNIRQNEKRRLRNKSIKSEMRTAVKKVLVAIKDKKKDVAEAALKSAYSSLDTAAAKGVVHKNHARRHKARLVARVNSLS
jgi:small subunit ribosomal protein S20